MTRINIVPVETLTRQHLIAEWRELPRVFALAHKASISNKPWTDRQPKQYTTGTGHVLFFYDRLSFLSNRHKALTKEMIDRGYKPSIQGDLQEQWQDSIPASYWRDYRPDDIALAINVERINKRLSGDKT